jgi:putative methionine-R-sulfoxide reductase with GAF domain
MRRAIGSCSNDLECPPFLRVKLSHVARSEVVIPVFCGGSQPGVLAALLDIDSPVLNNFSPELVEALQKVCVAVGQALF